MLDRQSVHTSRLCIPPATPAALLSFNRDSQIRSLNKNIRYMCKQTIEISIRASATIACSHLCRSTHGVPVVPCLAGHNVC